ncbi:hypothetical protein [Euzebya sp.]|uniref:hypothetical protein n=1 Tax=Euzebya sp. TaxID=1971409 RepID=UPI0035136D5F
MDRRPHVGTLREGPLHAALKRWYAEEGDLVEEPVDGFVIDLVRDGVLIEIQTRGFASMARKLGMLLADHPVRVVHPIAVDRWIVKVDDDGVVTSRRRSPKHGVPADVFGELVGVTAHLAHPGLTVELVLTREEELRRHEPGRAWRRGGWVVQERRLVEVVDRVVVGGPAGWSSLLPADLPDPFTTADLAEQLGRPRRLGQQMAYCLRHAGVLVAVGKRGGAVLHAVTR